MLVSKTTWSVAALVTAVNLALPTYKGVDLIRHGSVGQEEARVLQTGIFDTTFRVRLSWTVPPGCTLRNTRGYAVTSDAVLTVPVYQSGPDAWSFDLSGAKNAVAVALETERACGGALPRPHRLGPWKIERTTADDHAS